MPELQFRGKEFVYNHHLTVPFRSLKMHAKKGIGDARLDGNLIVHGDNLHALKARCAGRGDDPVWVWRGTNLRWGPFWGPL